MWHVILSECVKQWCHEERTIPLCDTPVDVMRNYMHLYNIIGPISLPRMWVRLKLHNFASFTHSKPAARLFSSFVLQSHRGIILRKCCYLLFENNYYSSIEKTHSSYLIHFMHAILVAQFIRSWPVVPHEPRIGEFIRRCFAGSVLTISFLSSVVLSSSHWKECSHFCPHSHYCASASSDFMALYKWLYLLTYIMTAWWAPCY